MGYAVSVAVDEINQVITVVDLDFKHSEQVEAERAGNLGSGGVVHSGKVESNCIYVRLMKAGKSKFNFLGAG
jgi:hypothetical protein